MRIYTDKISTAENYITGKSRWREYLHKNLSPGISTLSEKLIAFGNVFVTDSDDDLPIDHFFVVTLANLSQYDTLINAAKEDIDMPDKIFCLAEAGRNFHGLRKRPWAALEGNIHLSVYLKPGREIRNFGVGFIVLSAVSVVQTIDSIPGLRNRAGIKWVNDVVIDGAKAAGVLAHTQTIDRTVKSAILGIGLNVEKKPDIETSSFVKDSTSICELVPDRSICGREVVFRELAKNLMRNYDELLSGNYGKLLDIYRQRSVIIGKEVLIHADSPDGNNDITAEGVVESIGDNLELYLEGRKKPVTSGRLAYTKDSS